ncbi:MAG: hypothetical protein AB7O67_19185 [Vicinamibacterales bacterium]
MTSKFALSSLAAIVALTVACSGSPATPLSPSATTGVALNANADGSTLKIDAPVPSGPGNSETIDTIRPTFTFANATSTYLGSTIAGVSYRLQLLTGGGTLVDERTVAQGSGSTSYEADTNLDYASDYAWRVRAELDGAYGPWSPAMFFRTPNRPQPGGTPTGTVGAPRNIGFDEAYGIIRRIYDELRFNIGGSSTREQRNVYLAAAVAAIHYGHPRFNPAGPDNDWCIKDAGSGRPQADDVIVICSTRDAWDLVLSIGGDHYHWEPDYIGRLSGSQNVYAPPVGALAILGQ